MFYREHKSLTNEVREIRQQIQEGLVRLVNIEQKIDQQMQESLARLVNIERKVDDVAAAPVGAAMFCGHADQGFGHLTYAQFGEDLIVANAVCKFILSDVMLFK